MLLSLFTLVCIVLVFITLARAIKGRPVRNYTYADGSSGVSDTSQHGCGHHGGHHGDSGGHGGCDGGGH